MSPRRRRTTTPRCRDCGALVAFFRHSGTGPWRSYHLIAVDPHTHTGTAYPVWNGGAWTVPDLIDELCARQHLSRDDAEDTVYALPWHVRHDCRTTTTSEEEHHP